MKQYLILLLFYSLSNILYSQTIITGVVKDASNETAVEYATAFISDSAGVPITGTTTNNEGFFKLSTDQPFNAVEISFMGYKKKKLTEFTATNGSISLGVILIEPDQAVLNEVVIEGEESQTVIKLDKRVFNVGKDLSSNGANALEVLDNVPSVTVDIEGQVSLRGSQGVQILINGKPSVLSDQGSNALGTITADMIDRVEVITNPSAKYDAQGTAGIINIVLKKEEKTGTNGSVTINGGIPNNNSVGFSLNHRTEKLNFFTQLGAGRRTYPSDNITENFDRTTNTLLRSEGESEKNETFYNAFLGVDYHLNKWNVITVSGSFAYEIEDENSESTFSYLENANTTQSWLRNENTEATNPKWQYEVQYKKDFKRHKEQSLVLSATSDYFGKDKSSEFENATISGAANDDQQFSNTDFKESTYDLRADYTHPFTDELMLEIGSHNSFSIISNDYEVLTLQGNQQIIDTNLTNLFEFNQNVYAGYTTLGYQQDKWGVKGGVRYEYTDLETHLRTTNQSNTQNYGNFFPSAHASYNASKSTSLQLGYSRRIFRPRLWELNPFFNIRNNFSISTGNPNLTPEYTDSYEFTVLSRKDKITFSSSIYHRFTTDVIEDVTSFENNVSVTRPVNAGTNSISGVDANFKYNLAKWVTLRGEFNWFYFDRTGEFRDTPLDYDGNRWTANATALLKLPHSFEVEIRGDYQSQFNTIQGNEREIIFANLGMRKKFLNGRLVANLSVRDVFNSRKFQTVTDQPEFRLYSSRQRGTFISAGLSYGFGKGDAMEFSSRKRI